MDRKTGAYCSPILVTLLIQRNMFHKTYLLRLRMNFSTCNTLKYATLNLELYSIITLIIRIHPLKTEINLHYALCKEPVRSSQRMYYASIINSNR
jgi:hypothetical protein